MKRSPGDDTIKSELIQCLKEMKQYDRALEWYSTWIKETPQNNQLYWQGRLDIARTMFDQGKFEHVKNLIDGLQKEDPSFGGETFKSQFQELGEKCLEDLAKSDRVSQISGAEQTAGFQDKE